MRWRDRDACLRFLMDLAGPVSNKGTEWALRFALTRGLIDTARNRGHNLLEFLQHTPQAPAAQRGSPSSKAPDYPILEEVSK